MSDSHFMRRLTKIKSRYKVVESWQLDTDDYKVISYVYRMQQPLLMSVPHLPDKVGLCLFAYVHAYRSKVSRRYKGKEMEIVSESDDGSAFTVLNTSTQDPNSFSFRGQLIRMERPLLTDHNHVAFEIYFEKIPPQRPAARSIYDKRMMLQMPQYKPHEKVLVKATVEPPSSSSASSNLVRIKLNNVEQVISADGKTVILELNASQITTSAQATTNRGNSSDSSGGDLKNNDDDSDDNGGFDTDEEDVQYAGKKHTEQHDFEAATEMECTGFDQGDPFVSGEYYFVGIISNKVDTFDTDPNNYHLDGFGIDSATDYIYDGEGNEVLDTEELENPWHKPAILNLDVVRCEINMARKTLTFYKNGEKFGPPNKDYTLSFNHYGSINKEWFPAVCIMNKNVQAVFKYV
mmetsp:Transcript_26037/g.42558  ORF Transcript_26037/g.42558 Transcript_26037/m.42558 type:complete len:405 (-) Transcript_26037:85-1299(-)|eukprot:CAMPEP_0202714006 /NCGR_PEP_ID=MMETSP1385-20130828/62270_1 /ASSEMBLY_ACC=CAM_ASM_000861 /TAXON_ID=933848 /ORGANISM="Elphidium margaritaceum" /LENGTH=404 /DNA_ID=CAMNT_0049374567 /DNA_START=26 /DNA_END=1240 /DNA_ORIENTATION=-